MRGEGCRVTLFVMFWSEYILICDSACCGNEHCVKMVCIRPAVTDDLLAMQKCNLMCLPENYQLKVALMTMLTCTHTHSHPAVLLLPHPELASTPVRR